MREDQIELQKSPAGKYLIVTQDSAFENDRAEELSEAAVIQRLQGRGIAAGTIQELFARAKMVVPSESQDTE